MMMTKVQFLKNSQGQIVFQQMDKSKIKKSVKKIYFPLPFLSFAFGSLGQMVAHSYRWNQRGLRVEFYNMKKSFLEGLNFW